MKLARVLRGVAALVCLAGTIAGSVVLGQEKQPVFASDVSQVRLHVAVFDKKGVPVSGLTPDDFEVVEDGVRQQTGFVFGSDESPVDVAIVLDMSASMVDSMRAATHAASRFAEALGPEDCFLFLPFAGAIAQPAWVAGGADLPPISEAAVGPRDRTALTDAILTAQVMLRTRRVDDVARRAGLPVVASCGQQGERHGTRRQLLVVVSDGLDSASRASWGSVMDNMLESQVPVISIFAGRSPERVYGPDHDVSWRTFSMRRMEALGLGSGGIFESLAGKSYSQLFERLLKVMRATYIVTFPRTPESRANAAPWRQLEVLAPGNSGEVLAPSGYYVDGGDADRGRTNQGLAARLLQVGSVAAAVQFLREATLRAPNSWTAQADLAHALELQAATDEALEFALRATRLRPTVGHVQAARLAASLGRSELALEQAIRAAQAGDDVDELLSGLMAELPAARLRTVNARLEAPRVFLATTSTADLRTYLRVRDVDAMLARMVSDSQQLALVRDLSRADFLLWIDVVPDSDTFARDGWIRSQLRLNLPRHLRTRPPSDWFRPDEDSPFLRLRPRSLESTSLDFEDTTTAEVVESLLRSAIEELEGWIEARQ